MSNPELEAAPVDATDADALALMRLVHLIEAVHHDRATSQLDLRQRLVIQGLGLWGPTTIALRSFLLLLVAMVRSPFSV